MPRVRPVLGQRYLLLTLGIVLLGFTVTPSAAGAATLGKTTVGGSNGGGLIANAKRVNAYQLTVPALVSKLDIYLSPSGAVGSQVMEGVIYADKGGSPGALVAQSQEVSFSNSSHAGWYDLPMGSTVTLNPGKYWLGIYTGGTSAVASYRYDNSTSTRARNANSQAYSVGGASDPFGASSFSDRYLMSLYATYTTPAWTLQSLPISGQYSYNGYLTGVACTSTSSCIAVGNLGGPNDYGAPGATLAERRSGNTWSMMKTPNPAGFLVSEFNADACASPTMCMAVGWSGDDTSPGSSVVLAERWNGSAWSIQTLPNPSGYNTLNAVSCPSTTSCVAVGTDQLALGGTYLPLVERWNGISWSVESQPTGLTGTLSGVSCSSATACTAVGSLSAADSTTYSVERFDGSTWSLQTTPPGVKLGGVACPSANACFAVGSTAGSSAAVERWDGATWSIQPTLNPTGASRSTLSGISCPSATACTAVGYHDNPDSNSQRVELTLAEHWNGTSWTTQPTPNMTPSPLGGWLQAVSCPTRTACDAVGFNDGGTGYSTLPLLAARLW